MLLRISLSLILSCSTAAIFAAAAKEIIFIDPEKRFFVINEDLSLAGVKLESYLVCPLDGGAELFCGDIIRTTTTQSYVEIPLDFRQLLWDTKDYVFKKKPAATDLVPIATIPADPPGESETKLPPVPATKLAAPLRITPPPVAKIPPAPRRELGSKLRTGPRPAGSPTLSPPLRRKVRAYPLNLATHLKGIENRTALKRKALEDAISFAQTNELARLQELLRPSIRVRRLDTRVVVE